MVAEPCFILFSALGLFLPTQFPWRSVHSRDHRSLLWWEAMATPYLVYSCLRCPPQVPLFQKTKPAHIWASSTMLLLLPELLGFRGFSRGKLCLMHVIDVWLAGGAEGKSGFNPLLCTFMKAVLCWSERCLRQEDEIFSERFKKREALVFTGRKDKGEMQTWPASKILNPAQEGDKSICSSIRIYILVKETKPVTVLRELHAHGNQHPLLATTQSWEEQMCSHQTQFAAQLQKLVSVRAGSSFRKKFAENQGFYLVLIVCMCVCGGTKRELDPLELELEVLWVIRCGNKLGCSARAVKGLLIAKPSLQLAPTLPWATTNTHLLNWGCS